MVIDGRLSMIVHESNLQRNEIYDNDAFEAVVFGLHY